MVKKALTKESMKTQPKKRKNSRAKGANFERKVAKMLSDWWGGDFHRVPASGGLRWGKDNRVTGDIVAPAEDAELFPFSIECKKHEGWLLDDLIKGTGKIVDWWEQCTRDASTVEKVPLLIFSRNNQPTYFMVRYEDFVKLSENGTRFLTNYLITTLQLTDGDLECVGIGFFDKLTDIEKENLVKLLS